MFVKIQTIELWRSILLSPPHFLFLPFLRIILASPSSSSLMFSKYTQNKIKKISHKLNTTNLKLLSAHPLLFHSRPLLPPPPINPQIIANISSQHNSTNPIINNLFYLICVCFINLSSCFQSFQAKLYYLSSRKIKKSNIRRK